MRTDNAVKGFMKEFSQDASDAFKFLWGMIRGERAEKNRKDEYGTGLLKAVGWLIAAWIVVMVILSSIVGGSKTKDSPPKQKIEQQQEEKKPQKGKKKGRVELQQPSYQSPLKQDRQFQTFAFGGPSKMPAAQAQPQFRQPGKIC